MSMPLIPDQYRGTTGKNNFPIMIQLGLLTLVLLGVFGALWIQNPTTQIASLDDQYTTVPMHSASTAIGLEALDDVSLRAKAAYVWDVKGERALYKKNETESLPLASITKLMTALVVHELFPDNQVVTIPVAAIRQEGNSGLQAGENLTIAELTEFSLLASSNDAAYTLAASVGTALGERDPTQQFVSGMNIRAQELGLHSLDFKNMTGLDESRTVPGGVGTARDVSFLMEYIVENYPEILDSTRESGARIYSDDGVFHDLANTNPITNQIPNLIGSKTGYTDLAGGNLTIAFDLGNNRPIIITVLGSTRDARFSDVMTLVDAVQTAVKTESYE